MIFVAPYLGGMFCTLERLADHIEHVARVGGDDCVALGSDYDGFMVLPRGMRDAADLPRLTELLWRRGWRGERLTKLLGGNALRYLGLTEPPRVSSQRASESVSVSVSEFVLVGGSRLAVFRFAWVESVGNHGVGSGFGQPRERQRRADSRFATTLYAPRARSPPSNTNSNTLTRAL